VPVELPSYPFINYEVNDLRYNPSSPTMKMFFEKWRRLAESRQGNLNIVHIGGSHVQAGTMSNTIRCNILHAYEGLVAGRGMLFPYSAAARCNNPADYRVHCPQKVTLTRNIYKEYPMPLGLCGISITAADTLTEVAIEMNEPTVDYSTSRIVVFGRSGDSSRVVPLLHIGEREVYPSYVDPRTDRFIFNLTHPTDSFSVILPCHPGQQFTLTGILLDNRRAGFTFHSIGVNGAAVNDYLRCENFVRDLRMLHPDMVIFGIGINDAAAPNFDTADFHAAYRALVDSVRSVNPDCALVFITNNDSFRKVKSGRKRRVHYEVNRNGLAARDVFYRLASETGGAVWDQFEVMGGLKSMEKWQKNKLAQKDRVHFTAAGYRLIGDLLTNALFEELRKK
jgi:lysophospholipase L1-like esterase